MPRTRSGFSFVEIMMVVFMLCICILPIMGYIHHTTRATGHTMDRSLAMTIATQTMERYRNWSYDQLLAKCGTALAESDVNGDSMLSTSKMPTDLQKRFQSEGYQRTVHFTDQPDTRGGASGNLKVGLLTIEVGWKPANLTSDAKLSICRIIPSKAW